MGVHYHHLTREERDLIEKQSSQGVSVREIARRLGRHHSTIYEELKRNSFKPGREHANYARDRWGLDSSVTRARRYSAETAERYRKERAVNSHQPYRLADPEQVEWVVSKIKDHNYSPEMVAGRVRLEFPDDPKMWVSHETIYKFVFEQERQLREYLPRGQMRRRKRGGRKCHTRKANLRRNINERPTIVEDRKEAGHWEGDSVLGQTGTGNIHTSVERRSRFMIGKILADGSAPETLRAMTEIYQGLPVHMRKTVTVDNGSEFASWADLEDKTETQVYFADPYAPWQRGTNEHHNGRLRRFLPKDTSFTDLTQEELDEIIAVLNNQPRKCLGWRTPAEVYYDLKLDRL